MGVYQPIGAPEQAAQQAAGHAAQSSIYSYSSEWTVLVKVEIAEATSEALLGVEEADSEIGYMAKVLSASFQEAEAGDECLTVNVITHTDLLRLKDPDSAQEEMQEANLWFGTAMNSAIREIHGGRLDHQLDRLDNQAKAAGGGAGGSSPKESKRKSRLSKDFIQDIIALKSSVPLRATLGAAHRELDGKRYASNPLAERLIEHSLLEMYKLDPEGTKPIAQAYAEQIGLKKSINLLGETSRDDLIIGVGGNISDSKEQLYARLALIEGSLQQAWGDMTEGLCDPSHPYHVLARSLQMAGLAADERKRLKGLREVADCSEAINEATRTVDRTLKKIEQSALKVLRDFSEQGSLPQANGKLGFESFAVSQGIARSLTNPKTRKLSEQMADSEGVQSARGRVEETTGRPTTGTILALDHIDWLNTKTMDGGWRIMGCATPSRTMLILLPESDCRAVIEQGETLNPVLIHELVHTTQQYDRRILHSTVPPEAKARVSSPVVEHGMMEAATEMVATSIRRQDDPGSEVTGYQVETLVLESMFQAQQDRLPSLALPRTKAYAKLATQHADREEDMIRMESGLSERSGGGFVRKLSALLLKDTSEQTEGLLSKAIEERLAFVGSQSGVSSGVSREHLVKAEAEFWTGRLVELVASRRERN